MGFVFKCLVAVILILCVISTTTIVAYYATSYREQMEARDITSEGPDCRTMKWYVMDAIGKFDDVVCEFSKAVGNDKPLRTWRIWLENEYGVTMY